MHSQCGLVAASHIIVQCRTDLCSSKQRRAAYWQERERVDFSQIRRYHSQITGLPGNDRGAFCLSRVGRGAEVRRGRGSMLGMCTCTRSPSPDNTIEYSMQECISAVEH